MRFIGIDLIAEDPMRGFADFALIFPWEVSQEDARAALSYGKDGPERTCTFHRHFLHWNEVDRPLSSCRYTQPALLEGSICVRDANNLDWFASVLQVNLSFTSRLTDSTTHDEATATVHTSAAATATAKLEMVWHGLILTMKRRYRVQTSVSLMNSCSPSS